MPAVTGPEAPWSVAAVAAEMNAAGMVMSEQSSPSAHAIVTRLVLVAAQSGVPTSQLYTTTALAPKL